MTRQTLWQAAVLAIGVIGLSASTTLAGVDPVAGVDDRQLLPGDRVLIGTVESIRGDQAQVQTGELQPRFVPLGVRKAKGLPDLKPGDRLEITVNDQNLLVDVHVTGESSHHLVVHGQLAQPLVTGHYKAVIRTPDGREESHLIRPVARSKAASIPVGVDAVFLIDELNRIVDVTFDSQDAVHRAAELWQKKTPLKGNFSRINVVILKPLEHDRIAVQIETGEERRYEVRPLIQQRMQQLTKGDEAVLLMDDENKVTDVAIPWQARER
jgi:hypothetical protein